MSQRPFRFVHASDLHLERMPYGLREAPDHLRELILEAPIEEIEVAEKVVVETMEGVVDLDVPLRVDTATGPDLASVKS